jgi:hypothetical protein
MSETKANVDRQQRRRDRAKLLVAIENSFNEVINDTDAQRQNIYNAAFSPEHMLALDTEEKISEAQRLAESEPGDEERFGFFSKIKRSLSPKENIDKPLLKIQSRDASASLPQSIDGFNHNPNSYVKNIYTETRKARLFFSNHKKSTITVLISIIILVAVVLMVTVSDFSNAPWNENMETISQLLVAQGVPSSNFRNADSPQHKSLKWLGDELYWDDLKLDAAKADDPEFSVDDYDIIQDINSSYKQNRLLLERYALGVLFYSTSLDSNTWKNKNNWVKSGISPTSWYGVTVSGFPANGSTAVNMQVVTRINLSSNGLEGIIPLELKFLSNLEYLYLDENKLSKNVPEELGDLKFLKSMRINDNFLTGYVPTSICQLRTKGTLKELYSSCGGSKNAIECTCCTECL